MSKSDMSDSDWKKKLSAKVVRKLRSEDGRVSLFDSKMRDKREDMMIPASLLIMHGLLCWAELMCAPITGISGSLSSR